MRGYSNLRCCCCGYLTFPAPVVRAFSSEGRREGSEIGYDSRGDENITWRMTGEGERKTRMFASHTDTHNPYPHTEQGGREGEVRSEGKEREGGREGEIQRREKDKWHTVFLYCKLIYHPSTQHGPKQYTLSLPYPTSSVRA